MSVMAAAANYNEVYNAITLPDGRLGGDPSQKDPMFCWDTHFPDRLSRLTLTSDFTAPCAPPSSSSSSLLLGGAAAARLAAGGSAGASARINPRSRRANRNAARFKTQPITFDEIKEVDEEAVVGSGGGTSGAGAGANGGGGDAKTAEEAKESLKSQFANFSRSMDGLVVAPFARESGSGSASGGAISMPSCSESQASSEAADHLGGGGVGARSSAAAISATVQRQQFRQRRKKRHTKSIEEAPELDKTEAQDGTG